MIKFGVGRLGVYEREKINRGEHVRGVRGVYGLLFIFLFLFLDVELRLKMAM